MTFSESLAARRIYDLECQRDERTFARDHSFEEWLEWWLRECGASQAHQAYSVGIRNSLLVGD